MQKGGLIPLTQVCGVRDSNVVEVLSILEALHIYSSIFIEEQIIESNNPNVISWL